MALSDTDSQDLDYLIDDRDRIAHVSAGWNEFAFTNGSPHLSSDAVVGKSIWDHITGPLVRNLYEEFLRCVREHQRTAEFPFRCDSPTERRFLRMRLLPQADNRIAITTHLLRRESREAVPLLAMAAADSGDAIEMCSFCKKVRIDATTWVTAEAAVAALDLFGEVQRPGISHSVCPACVDDMNGRLGL